LTIDVQPFNSVNAYSITNIKFQGIKALQRPKYEDLKIKQFRQKYKGKNIRLQVISHHHVQQQEGVDKCKKSRTLIWRM